MQKITFFVIALLCAGALNAQTFSITGQAKDNTGAAIPAAPVTLLKVIDSTLVFTELTGDNGEFSFKAVPAGNYILNVQATGYTKPMQPITVGRNVEGVTLVAIRDARQLKEVTVSDKKPYIETGMGKTTVNVDQAAISAGSNVIDLLRKSPGVSVDGNGNVSLKGSGALIMIDDKQTYLSGDQLTAYLRSLSADQVAQLELITQPSSKYDAEGGSIINIKMKKLKKRGLNGNTSNSYGQGIYGNTHNNFNLNYRTDKVNLYTNAGYLHATGFLDQQTERKYIDPATGVQTNHNSQTSFFKETFEDYSLKLGADYTINDKLTAGGSAQGIYHPNKEIDVTRSTITDNITNAIVYNNTTNDHGFRRYHYTGNLYCKYTPAKDHDININTDYISRNSWERQHVTSLNYNEQYQPAAGDLVLKGTMPRTIDVFVANADYAGKLSEKTSMEAGVKTTLSHMDDDSQFEVLQNNVFVPDTVRTSHFIYDEYVNAAYASLNTTFNKKWQAQVGLRVEHTTSKGHQLVRDQSFNRNYTGLFPTGYVNYTANDKHSFQCSFGRRIIRPSYKDLDPFLVFISQYTYSGGNPNLLPAYRNYLELSHNYNNMLFSGVGIRKIGNTVNPVSLYNAITKAVYTTSINNADRWVLELSCAFNKQVLSWWLLSSSVGGYYNQYAPHNAKGYLASSFSGEWYFENQFMIDEGWTIDTSFHIATGNGLMNLTERSIPNHYIRCSVAKKLLKDTATLRLSVDDPFYSYRWGVNRSWNGVESSSIMAYNSRVVNLGFTYNFGKRTDNARQREHSVEEAGRM